jgi:hypothetical protein
VNHPQQGLGAAIPHPDQSSGVGKDDRLRHLIDDVPEGLKFL